MGQKQYKIELLENYTLPKFLLFLLEHLEGVQKVDLRNNLGLASTTSVRIPKICFETNLITTKPDIEKLLFILTEKGKKLLSI